MKREPFYTRRIQYTLPNLRGNDIPKGYSPSQEFNARQSVQRKKRVKASRSILVKAVVVQLSFQGGSCARGVEVPIDSNLWPKLSP